MEHSALAMTAATKIMSSFPLAGLSPKKFSANPLYAAEGNGRTPGFFSTPQPAPFPVPKGTEAESEATDPIQGAFDAGFAAGEAEAKAKHDASKANHTARIAALDAAFTKMEISETRELGQKMQQLVLALCEQTMAPLAVDKEALARRVEAASAMLMRAQDERKVRLHPDDIALIQDIVPAGLDLLPDGSLARGALRIETEDGGVEDGPATWRAALEEALGIC